MLPPSFWSLLTVTTKHVGYLRSAGLENTLIINLWAGCQGGRSRLCEVTATHLQCRPTRGEVHWGKTAQPIRHRSHQITVLKVSPWVTLCVHEELFPDQFYLIWSTVEWKRREKKGDSVRGEHDATKGPVTDTWWKNTLLNRDTPCET